MMEWPKKFAVSAFSALIKIRGIDTRRKLKQPGNSISSVARKYEVHPNQLFKWRRLIHEGALMAAQSEEPLVPLRGLRMVIDV